MSYISFPNKGSYEHTTMTLHISFVKQKMTGYFLLAKHMETDHLKEKEGI